MQTGEVEQAIEHFKRVTQLAPEEDSVHYRLASAYKKLGRKEEERAELSLFEKLKKAREEREKQARIISSVQHEEPEDSDRASPSEP
jgi:tetratricopeptide (TPR) repeat protein